jgi:hypothetical protein
MVSPCKALPVYRRSVLCSLFTLFYWFMFYLGISISISRVLGVTGLVRKAREPRCTTVEEESLVAGSTKAKAILLLKGHVPLKGHVLLKRHVTPPLQQ